MSNPTPGTSSASSVDNGPTTRYSNQSYPGPKSKPVKPDHTLLKPPITTSITGLKQAIFALENSTPEVRELLIHECNLIYECKACMNLFRSLANFISHKRGFCRTRLRDRRHLPRTDGDLSSDNPSSVGTVVVTAEEPIDTIVPNDFCLLDYSPSIELMKDLEIIRDIEQRPLVSNLKPSMSSKKSLENVVRDLKAKTDSSFDAEYYNSKEIRLESMRYTSQGVFQTQSNATMGEQYVNLERARNTKKTVVVDPFNRVLQPGDPQASFREKVYESAPASSKNTKNLRFPCPHCDKNFCRVHRVVQHLQKVHNYTQREINRQRAAIRKSKFTVIRKRSAAPVLTQSIVDDIRNRQCFVKLQRLTDAKISRWTKTSFSSPELATAKEGCSGSSNSDSSKKKSESRHTSVDLVPSIIADCHLNQISENKSNSEKKTTDDDAKVLYENGNVSMSGRVEETREITAESETTVTEDDAITSNLHVDATDVPAPQESHDVDVESVRKKRKGKPRFVLQTLTRNSLPTQRESPVISAERNDVDTTEIPTDSSEIAPTARKLTDMPKSQSRRKLSRNQITKVALIHTEANGESNGKTKLDIDYKTEDIETFKTTRSVEPASNESESKVANGKSKTPSPVPQPVSAKLRGRKRKRFESDLSSCGSGFSASSSRDPSPNRKFGVTDKAEADKSNGSETLHSSRTGTLRRFRSSK